MAIDLQALEQKWNALLDDPNFVTDFEQWLYARNKRQNAANAVLCEGLSLRTTVDLYNRLYIGEYGLMAKDGLPEGQWTRVIANVFLDLQSCIQELNRLKLSS